MGFKGSPKRSGFVDSDLCFVPTAMGRGLATEAVAQLIPWAVRDPRVKRIVATTDSKNLASQRVLTKNGLRPVPNESDPGELCFEMIR